MRRGRQLAQTHMGSLQEYWEMNPDLAQSQTTLPLGYNLDSPVSYSSLKLSFKRTLPLEERMGIV